MTTTLYGWGPLFGCPSPSPFVMKADMQLQMLGVDFDYALADLQSVPKQKAPYVMDDGQLIQDTNFIRAHFEAKAGRQLDDALTSDQRASGWGLERMAEGHLRSAILSERWLNDDNFDKGPVLFFMGVPEEARKQVCDQVRADIAGMMQGEGFGRHSQEERMQLAAWDVAAIAAQLGDRAFLFGDTPTVADAGVGGMIISAETDFFDTPLTQIVRQHDNLVAYIDRLKQRFFAVDRWPSMG